MPLELDHSPAADAIGTLEELIRVIDEVSAAEGYEAALKRFTIEHEDLVPFCQWNSRHYTRQCLHRTPKHELLLICYEPGQRTSIHDYDSQLAWIKPLVGKVKEERFVAGPDGSVRRKEQHVLLPGDLSHMATKNCIHRHSNVGLGRAITLNLYTRPIRRWRVYDERTGRASLSGAGTGSGE